MFLLHLFLITSVLFSNSLHAQDTLPTLIVRAQRDPVMLAPLDDTDHMGMNTIYATDVDIHHIHQLRDAIVRISGIHTHPNPDDGAMASVFIRGGNSNHAAVIIDGMSVNDPATGTFDFAGIGAMGMNTIHVDKGVNIANIDDQALSGAIVLETKRGENGSDGLPQWRTEQEIGPQDTLMQHGAIEGGISDRVDYHVHTSHHRTAGNVTRSEPYRLTQREYEPDASSRKSIVSRTGAQLNDAWRVSLWNHIHHNHADYADPWMLNPAQRRMQKRHYHRIDFAYQHAQFSQHIGTSIQSTHAIHHDEMAPYSPRTMTEGRTQHVYAQHRYEFTPYYAARTDLNYTHDHYQQELQYTPRIAYRTQRQTAALGHEITPIRDWRITWWTRAHRHASFTQRYSHHVRTDYRLPQIRTRVIASYGTGARTPTLMERFDTRGGNPYLRPESAKGYDAGIIQPIGESVTLGYTYFRQDYQELIVNQPIPNSIQRHRRYENIGRARMWGHETCIILNLFRDAYDHMILPSKRLKAPIEIKFEHTFLHTKDGTTNQQLIHRPMHKLNGHLLWNISESDSLGVGLMHFGKYADRTFDTSARVYRRGPTILRIFGSHAMHKQIDIFFRIENALQNTYSYPDGYKGTERSLFMGMRIHS